MRLLTQAAIEKRTLGVSNSLPSFGHSFIANDYAFDYAKRYSLVTHLTCCERPFKVRFSLNAAIPIKPIHDWIELLTGLD